MYSIVRLIIIALMITYFIGCIFYYISNEVASNFILKPPTDVIAESSLRILAGNHDAVERAALEKLEG